MFWKKVVDFYKKNKNSIQSPLAKNFETDQFSPNFCIEFAPDMHQKSAYKGIEYGSFFDVDVTH